MDMDQIREMVKNWEKPKRLRYAGLCGEYSNGISLEEAMKKAFNEVMEEDKCIDTMKK